MGTGTTPGKQAHVMGTRARCMAWNGIGAGMTELHTVFTHRAAGLGLLSLLSFFSRAQKGRLDGLNVFSQARFKACIVGDGGTSPSCIAALYYNIIYGAQHAHPF